MLKIKNNNKIRNLKVLLLVLTLVMVLTGCSSNKQSKKIVEQIDTAWNSQDAKQIKDIGLDNTHVENYLNTIRDKDIQEEDITKIKDMAYNKDIKLINSKETEDGSDVIELEMEITYTPIYELNNKIESAMSTSNKAGSGRVEIRKAVTNVIDAFDESKKDIIFQKVKIKDKSWEFYELGSSIDETKTTMINMPEGTYLPGGMSYLELKLTSDIPLILKDKNLITETNGDSKYREQELVSDEYIEDLGNNPRKSLGDAQIQKQINSEKARDDKNIITEYEYVESGSRYTGDSYENLDNFLIED